MEKETLLYFHIALRFELFLEASKLFSRLLLSISISISYCGYQLIMHTVSKSFKFRCFDYYALELILRSTLVSCLELL